MRKIRTIGWWWRTGDPYKRLVYCDFQNQSMKHPCGTKLLYTYGEPWCIKHGVARYAEMRDDEV